MYAFLFYKFDNLYGEFMVFHFYVVGTLKDLGFKDRRVTLHYTAYAFITAVFGCIIGFGLGYFVCWFIMNPNGSMGTYFDMPEWKLYMPGLQNTT